MTARAQARIHAIVASRIDLPTGPYPQNVNEHGYEVPPGFKQEDDAGEEPGTLDQVGTSGNAIAGEEQGEQLLSIADSLILPYSLLHTRQRHLRYLLPHIFSHPPLPSSAKPRARPLPQGIFTFPTPPRPDLPLPYKEYHGPQQQSNSSSKQTTTPPVDASATPPPGTNVDNNVNVPAHEIDCIGRVTLSVGPISYPGTEVWVGRWVESRGVAVKRKKLLGSGTGTGTTVGAGGQIRKSRLTSVEEPTRTKKQKVNPPPGTFIPYQPPIPAAPVARPASSHVVTKSGIPPILLERVNKAATTHPWLSIIIHRAAKHEATREELAKLGRVVGRLGRGEDVGEGPNDGLSRPIGMGVNSVAGPSRPAATPSISPAAVVTLGRDESDDEEVDMTGPKQVGGGPMDVDDPPDPARLVTRGRRPSPVKLAQQAASAASSSSSATAKNSPFTSTGPLNPPPKSAITKPAITPIAQPATTPFPPMRPPQTAFPALPSPIPRMIHKPPPPFLLVAFKENPTEKYLLPLGSQSFISRVGGDYVTSPAPPPPPPPSSAILSATDNIATNPSRSVSTDPAPESSLSTAKADAALTDVPIPRGPAKGKARSRKSFGRNAKLQPPSDANPATESSPVLPLSPEVTTTDIPVEPTLINAKPNLPPLPGTKPAPGLILVSTLIPCSAWVKPDWETLAKGIPWGNPAFAPAGPSSSQSITPIRQPDLLNIATTSFLPEEGALQAVTIRLEGVDDGLWRRMKGLIEEVEREEMRSLSGVQPDLLETMTPSVPVLPNLAAPAISSVVTPATPLTVTPTIPTTVPPSSTYSSSSTIRSQFQPFNPNHHPRLRDTYAQNKRQRFTALLKRVPTRKFLHLRLPHPPTQSLIEATSDKWAPRPYPISTKPLYIASPPTYPLPLPPAPIPKKKGTKGEGEVEFEMPVSLELLDERVEEGAKKAVGRRVGKLKGRGSAGAVEGFDSLGRRKHGIRAVKGKVCEGCGESRWKVWRRGPGGTATLCNGCGDKFAEGTLGELKAPAVKPTVGDEAGGEGDTGVGDGEIGRGEMDQQKRDDKNDDVAVKAEMLASETHSVEMSPTVKDGTLDDTRTSAPTNIDINAETQPAINLENGETAP